VDRFAHVHSTAAVVHSATTACAIRRIWCRELSVRRSERPVRAAAAADPAAAPNPAAASAATATTTAAPAYSSAAATSPTPAVASARAAPAPAAAAADTVAAATAPADPATAPVRAAADPSTPAATPGPACAVRSSDAGAARSHDVATVRRSLPVVSYGPGRVTSHRAAGLRSLYHGPSDVRLRRVWRNRSVAEWPQTLWRDAE